MATVKPTPEEKLFSVIQGAKAVPLRGRGSAKSFKQHLQQLQASIGPIDLPRINKLLMGVMALLVAGLIAQFFSQPNVDRLMAQAGEPQLFRIAPPLQGLKPLEEYLPKVLEQDPFHVGQTTIQASANPSEPAAANQTDAKAMIANLRLVGISWGDSPTAMIEQDKQTYFLKPGDALGALTIKTIEKDHVIFKSGDQEVELF